MAPNGWPAFSPVSRLQPDGANVELLGASLNYAGNWSLSAGTLALGGKVLTLSGSANLDGGVINGAGTLAVGGTVEISNLALEGSAVLKNGGTITQNGNLVSRLQRQRPPGNW